MQDRLPSVPILDTVIARLPTIFPVGVDHRNLCIRDMAARTIWVMYYVGAIEGRDCWIRPSQVTDMGDAQSRLTSETQRQDWHSLTLGQRKARAPDAWYAENSREPIRDETLRQGLIPTGAVIGRQDIPTTSSRPRYALEAEFAALFDETLDAGAFAAAAAVWRQRHLTQEALARLALIQAGTTGAATVVQVTLPNKATRNMAARPSSVISKAVIEEFAPRFLHTPALLWLSESGNRVLEADNALARRLGLNIDPARALPDIILVDIEPALLFVFVEVVATDGPVDQLRKNALTAIATEAGFHAEHLAFMMAFEDRAATPARALMPSLAWGTFAWFCSEPDKIVVFRNGNPVPISTIR